LPPGDKVATRQLAEIPYKFYKNSFIGGVLASHLYQEASQAGCCQSGHVAVASFYTSILLNSSLLAYLGWRVLCAAAA
jgi:hypothetical protein